MVSIQNYTPTDEEFLSSSIRVPPQLSDTKKKAKEPILALQSAEPDSIYQTICSLETEVKAKEELIRELWSSLKIQKEELAFLKQQRDAELEKEFSEGLIEAAESGFFDHKMIKGLDDRIVISVDIKPSGYQTYSLDAQVDTGAMNSCAKFGAIPGYYWQNTNLDFRAVNNTLMKIEKICPDFPL